MKVPGFRLVICCSVFMIVAASAADAQRRLRMSPPTALLDVLDKEDRECVLTNGGLSKSVTVQSIRLAPDGTRQLLVRGSGSCLCGAQNCGFWIYRKKNQEYELLLQGAGSTKVSAGSNSRNGYRDIISESHASAMETIVRTYRFDGREYHRALCVSRAFYDNNGKITKTAITRPCTPSSNRPDLK